MDQPLAVEEVYRTESIIKITRASVIVYLDHRQIEEWHTRERIAQDHLKVSRESRRRFSLGDPHHSRPIHQWEPWVIHRWKLLETLESH